MSMKYNPIGEMPQPDYFSARPVVAAKPVQPAPIVDKPVLPAPTANTLSIPNQNLGKPLPIKVSRIIPYEGQPRRYFNNESVERLADSIQASGQEQPIKVCTHPTEKGKFVLIDGERRYRAFKIIFERTKIEPTVDAFIEVIRDPKEHFRKSWVANLQREDISALDQAAGLYRLKEEGETFESLATMIGKSTTYIDNYLKLHTLSDEVKQLMDPSRPKDRRLSVTAAIEIARSTKDQKLRLEIAQETLQRELSLNDSRSLIEQRTGVAGDRVGGFRRKPSDDYKILTGFIGRTDNNLTRFIKLDFQVLYQDRINLKEDKAHDIVDVNNCILGLEILIDKIEKAPDNMYKSFDVLQVKSLLVQFQQLKNKIQVA